MNSSVSLVRLRALGLVCYLTLYKELDSETHIVFFKHWKVNTRKISRATKVKASEISISVLLWYAKMLMSLNKKNLGTRQALK